jgi:hypothetical protein
VSLGGLPGLVVTRGYHLLSLPANGNRIRVSLDWLLDWAMRPQVAQLGFLREEQATMAAAEHTGIYPGPPADEWEAASRDVPATRAVVTDTGVPRPRARSRQPG